MEHQAYHHMGCVALLPYIMMCLAPRIQFSLRQAVRLRAAACRKSHLGIMALPSAIPLDGWPYAVSARPHGPAWRASARLCLLTPSIIITIRSGRQNYSHTHRSIKDDGSCEKLQCNQLLLYYQTTSRMSSTECSETLLQLLFDIFHHLG